MRTFFIDDRERIERIIRNCKLCFVGMVAEDAIPYVLPMNFGYEEGVVYLHSAREGRSISILEKNPHVCLTFCTDPQLMWQNEEVACSYRMRSDSVICHGKVRFVEEDDAKVVAMDIIMKHYSERTFTYSAPAIRNVLVWRVELEQVSAKEFGVPSPHAIKYKDRNTF